MTFKVDDKVVVKVFRIEPNGKVSIRVDKAGACVWFDSSMVEPLPPSLTPEAQAVLDFVVKVYSVLPDVPAPISAYLATLTPPDPQAAVEAAARRVASYGTMATPTHIRALQDSIAALDESRKP